MIPALFNSTSTPPNAEVACSNMASMAAESVTSALAIKDRPPAASILSESFLAASGLSA
jgi:hypothetical protein